MSGVFWQGIDESALDEPVLFSIGVTVLFLLLLIAGIVLGRALTRNERQGHVGEAFGRLLGAAVLVFIAQRLGWLAAAGFGAAGTPRAWVLTGVALIYVVVAFPYALTGSLTFKPTDRRLAAPVALNAASAALIEEIAFRGIVLYVLVRAWEAGQAGVLGAVVVSSVLFSFIHVLNLLAGEPANRVAPQVAWSLLGGIFFAALVVQAMSIWPAVVLHAGANVAVRLNVLSKRDFAPSTRAYVRLAVLAVPLAVLGVAIL